MVGKRAKRVKVKFTAYGDESDKGKYRVPLSAPVEGGPSADGDRHVIVYDKARCKLYELYRAFPQRQRSAGTPTSGVIWDLRSAGLRTEGYTSADAAGLPIFPGLVRYDEVARRAASTTRSGSPSTPPATAGSTRPRTAPARPSQPTRRRWGCASGSRPAMTSRAISGEARVIAEALKQYGFINADNGSNWYFQGNSDPRWDDDNLNQLKEIPGSAFEVVRSQADYHAC